MSRLWRDQLHVFLAPGRVDWVRWKRGLKPIQTEKATAVCETVEDGPVWAAALQQLDKILSDAAGAELSLILSNHWVRYAVMPPQNEITTPEEVKSYADFRLREIYADRVDSWTFSISDWNPLTGAMCAAIPRDLLTQLEQLAADRRCKISVLEPYLASVYDRWQAQLQGDTVYMAVIEAGRICLAVIQRGIWQSVRNQRISHSAAEDLLTALDQEAIWSGAKEAAGVVHLFAPEHPELTLPQDSGWSIIPLPSGKLPVLAHYPSVPVNRSGIDQCRA